MDDPRCLCCAHYLDDHMPWGCTYSIVFDGEEDGPCGCPQVVPPDNDSEAR